MSSVANSLASGSQPGTRSGFIALAGRPNVGKSTLTNALVGSKVAIVSDKPQTTRRAIRAVAGGADWQLVLVDLPGVQRPRDALTERMQRRVESELDEADGCLMVVNAEQGIGPGDRFIASLLRGAKAPVVIAVNKVDRTDRAKTVEALQAVADLEISEAIFPISARRGTGVEELPRPSRLAAAQQPVLLRSKPALGPDRVGCARGARARADPVSHARGGAARR